MAYKNWNVTGCLLPIITPFKDDYSLDESGLRRLIDYYIEEEKVKAIIPCGTTGESPTLSNEEHRRVIEITIQHVAGRVPVMAGTGSNSTREAIELTRHAEHQGAEATLQVGPYYNRPGQDGIFRHFEEIAKNTSLPVFIYNIPYRTGRNIEPETIVKLSEIENIAGLKDASADLAQTTAIIQGVKGRDFYIYSGEDSMTFFILVLGGVGAIAATGHVMAPEINTMYSLISEGRIAEARDIHLKFLDLMKKLFVEPNPAPIKQALKWMGLPAGPCRLPLTDLSANGQEILRKSLTAVGKIS